MPSTGPSGALIGCSSGRPIPVAEALVNPARQRRGAGTAAGGGQRRVGQRRIESMRSQPGAGGPAAGVVSDREWSDRAWSAGRGQTGRRQAGLVRPGVVRPGVVRPGVVRLGVVRPGVVRLGVVRPGVVRLGVVSPGLVRLGVVSVGPACAGWAPAGLRPVGTGGRLIPNCDSPATVRTSVRWAGRSPPRRWTNSWCSGGLLRAAVDSTHDNSAMDLRLPGRRPRSWLSRACVDVGSARKSPQYLDNIRV